MSANTGLPEAAATTGAVWGAGGGAEVGHLRLGTRALSFTCGSRGVDTFADWSGGGGGGDGMQEEAGSGGGGDEGSVMGAADCVSPLGGGGGGKVCGAQNGGAGRPVSPFHSRRHQSRPHFGR